ncbi:hypothetical protein [Halorussus caseinilyticus]|uniref:Uncharacterized protein n=1 Tax=Halorussus caseinilyticus TaxID=3034025 RepID=A0ABD5WLT4_9EURY|nr:hypothetical protein [Halorussus sp. DT72]
MSEDADGEPPDRWNFLHEELIPALLLVGVLLFLVPEPVTSTLGIVLVSLGVGLWVWDLLR